GLPFSLSVSFSGRSAYPPSFPTRRSSDLGEVPVYDPETYETNIPGIYVAGHLTNERHIKGAIDAAKKLVPLMTKKLPAKHAKVTDRKSTRLNSSHVEISYAVFCLKKKRAHSRNHHNYTIGLNDFYRQAQGRLLIINISIKKPKKLRYVTNNRHHRRSYKLHNEQLK